MTKTELEKHYCEGRPIEPYSDDTSPNDWASIAHYAEDYLLKTFEQIVVLEKENAELKERNRELLESCEGATMMYKDLCKAKELLKDLVDEYYDFCKLHGFLTEFNCIDRAEQFLKE